jgi:hypothetical protein
MNESFVTDGGDARDSLVSDHSVLVLVVDIYKLAV